MPGLKETLKGTQIKTNLRERVNAITLIPDNLGRMAEVVVEDLTSLKPVKALTDVGKLVGDGTLNFVQKQADVTRSWVPSKT